MEECLTVSQDQLCLISMKSMTWFMQWGVEELFTHVVAAPSCLVFLPILYTIYVLIFLVTLRL